MKDETKEIKINTIGQLLDYVETEEKANELIDYITNLQEEKDKYKNVIDKIKEYCIKEKVLPLGEQVDYILELLEEVE